MMMILCHGINMNNNNIIILFDEHAPPHHTTPHPSLIHATLTIGEIGEI